MQHQRHFQRAGHGGDGDVFGFHAHFLQLVGAHLQHGAADFVAETRLHNADAQAFAVEVGEQGFHGILSILIKVGLAIQAGDRA